MAQLPASAPAKAIPEGLPATLRPLGALPAEDAQDRFWNIVAILLTATIALGFLGVWAYSRVDGSLREIRTAGLRAMLEAESRVMLLWIEEKKRDAERWASTREVQREAATLARLAARGVGPAQICAAPSQKTLLAEIAPYATLEEAVAYNLVSRDGTIIASQHPAYCGMRIQSADFMKHLAPVFAGSTIFIRPWHEADRVGTVRGAPLTRPLVWVETPVKGDDGEVIGALGFGRYAAQRFGKLLALDVTDSREAFAFDPRGVMLTETRYQDPTTSLPETQLVRSAIEGLKVGGLDGVQGVLLEPYVNYRGREVIGAWRWLPLKEMAIAVEIDATEAYAPLQYLRIAFGVLFGFLLASLLAAAGMSLWAIRLRQREAKRIGQYTIERQIGEGGLSHVYLARHPHLKRPTAVKVLKKHLASDEVVTRFEREVQLCSQLTHPNTIEIYDYGRTRDGTFYYAMEYLNGVSLQELIAEEGPMPVSRAVHALLQACGSLREAHRRGFIHRDVKPHNLMLCVRGGVYDLLKVLDFGLVKEMHNPDTRDITQFAKVLGTPLYMAPERLRNPADADTRSDIYALGAVAYYILMGRNLFQASSDHDLVYQVLNIPAPSLSRAGANDIPELLDSLVSRCLAKDRTARPATIAEVEGVLSDIARSRPWRESEARAWWEAREARQRARQGTNVPEAEAS